MNKRITSILLCFVMLFSMVVTAVPVYALDNVQMKVAANKATANPGDTVDFSVSIGAVTLLGGLEFWVRVPAGLTIVDSSIQLPAGLETTLDSDGAIGAPTAKNGYRWNYSAQMTGYTGTEDLVVVTFSCTVNNDCSVGDKVVTIEIIELFDNEDLDDFPYTITPATVKIEAKPVAVTGVTVDETLSLETGESKTLTVTVAPDDATNKVVSFSVISGDEFVTVDANGKVTGVKKGVATVQVKTADGGFTDTCTVTVSCAHANTTHKPANTATCQGGGNEAYKECEDCGQLFSNAGGEIDSIPTTGKDMSNHTGTAKWTQTAEKHSKAYDCCGTPVVVLENHEWTDGVCTECNYTCSHSGGTATCKEAATCQYCGEKYGTKNASNHVGGTTIVGQSSADHKNQVNGYTGDTKCLGCQQIIGYGTSIPAGDHANSAGLWSTDEGYHWKECDVVVGCGAVISGTREEHTSTGANVATCQKQAVCDVCQVSYGGVEPHSYTHADQKQAAQKSEGNCRDEAVYYYSCEHCGLVENNNEHTFKGDKVATNHIGGTTIVGQSSADHKNQIDGYTGDTKCLGCQQITDYGQPISAGAHVPSANYTTDGTHHWKVCTVDGCGVEIAGSKGSHSATGVNVANCKDAATCDICNTEYGTKNASNHVGGTQLVNQSSADHKNQVDGYTGDTKCLGCQEIIGYGQPIDANDHANSAGLWSTDDTYHWKECDVVGCGALIDGSKAQHTSTGANVATCQKKAVCDTCGASYGTVANHQFDDTTWEKDATGHWYKCMTTGCTEKKDFAQHTPDHQGHATEEYAIKCTVCDFEIEPKLTHTHVFDQEEVVDKYLANGATCTAAAKYYKSCKCGEKGTETFDSGDPLNHNHGAEWKSDKDNHWNECTCGDKANTAAHKDENTDGKCDVCAYNVGTSTTPESPQTGDSILLWISLLMLSALGVVATTILRKRSTSVK